MNQSATAERPGLKSRLLQEILIVGVGYLIYSQVRGLAHDRVVDAFTNAYHVIRIEQSLGIFEELAVQTFVRSEDTLVHFFNLVYFYGFFPLLLPTAVWLFIKHPRVYTLARNAFLLSGAIAVCFYLAVPTAPPRLLDVGLIDTLGRSVTPTYESIPGVNPYAAVPSMHVGWNFLTATAIFLAIRGHTWRPIVWLLPVVMLTATVATGNHYIIDGLLGILVAGAGLGLAYGVERYRQRGKPLPV